LDVKVWHKGTHLETSHFVKKTSTGLLKSPMSFSDFKHNVGIIKGSIHRVWCIASTYDLDVKDVDSVMEKLIKKGYRRNFVEKFLMNNSKRLIGNLTQELKVKVYIYSFPIHLDHYGSVRIYKIWA